MTTRKPTSQEVEDSKKKMEDILQEINQAPIFSFGEKSLTNVRKSKVWSEMSTKVNQSVCSEKEFVSFENSLLDEMMVVRDEEDGEDL